MTWLVSLVVMLLAVKTEEWIVHRQLMVYKSLVNYLIGQFSRDVISCEDGRVNSVSSVDSL